MESVEISRQYQTTDLYGQINKEPENKKKKQEQISEFSEMREQPNFNTLQHNSTQFNTFEN